MLTFIFLMTCQRVLSSVLDSPILRVSPCSIELLLVHLIATRWLLPSGQLATLDPLLRVYVDRSDVYYALRRRFPSVLSMRVCE